MRDSAHVIVRSPRLNERRRAVRAERRRRRMRVAVATLVMTGLAGGGWGLTRTAVFALERIEVVGVPATARSSILAAGGIAVGDPAIGIELDEVAARIRSLDSVEDVRVRRSGTLALQIEVRPRVAAIAVRAEDGRVLLDKHGEPVDAKPKRRIPVIESNDVLEARTVVATVLAIWSRASRSERKAIDSFEPTRAGLVALMGDTRVLFGDGEQIGAKLRALRLVTRRLAADDLSARVIDLRAPGRPATTLR